MPMTSCSDTSCSWRGLSPKSKHCSSPWPPATTIKPPSGCQTSTEGSMVQLTRALRPVSMWSSTTEESWRPSSSQRSLGSRHHDTGTEDRGEDVAERRCKCPRAHSYTHVWATWASSHISMLERLGSLRSSALELWASLCSSTVRIW